jgi:hypothetical protein
MNVAVGLALLAMAGGSAIVAHGLARNGVRRRGGGLWAPEVAVWLLAVGFAAGGAALVLAGAWAGAPDLLHRGRDAALLAFVAAGVHDAARRRRNRRGRSPSRPARRGPTGSTDRI